MLTSKRRSCGAKKEEQDAYGALRGSCSALALVQKKMLRKKEEVAAWSPPGVLPGMQANALSDQRDEINHHHRGGWLLGSGGGLAGDISQKTLTFSLFRQTIKKPPTDCNPKGGYFNRWWPEEKNFFAMLSMARPPD